MSDRDDGGPAPLRFPASALRRALLRAGVPHLMADHAAALLSALLPGRTGRADRSKKDERDR